MSRLRSSACYRGQVYRIPAARPDPLLVVPGDGLRDVLVGDATPDRVFAEFGRDAQVNRTPGGEIYEIDYDYVEEGVYEPTRPGNDSRPSSFIFKFGLLQAIEIGVYQSLLYTPGGVRIRSERSEVIAAFGSAEEVLSEDGTDTLRYMNLGVELRVSTSDDFGVSSFIIFRKRR